MKVFVKVKPNSKNEAIKEIDATHFEIQTKAAPREGKANSAVIKVLAHYFEVPKSKIKIVTGETSKQKIFEII